MHNSQITSGCRVKAKMLIGLLLLCSSFCVAQNNIRSTINLKNYLAQQDPVWDTLNAYFYDGPMTGNGLLGSVLHRMDKNRFDGNTNKFLFEINRADLTDSCSRRPEGYYWSRMQVGRFEFKPAGNVLKTTWRINLWDAEITGKIITDKGTVSIRHYTHALMPVLITQIETSGNENATDFHFVPDMSGCLLALGALDFQEKGKYDVNPPAILQNVTGILLHKQILKHSGRYFVVGSTSKTEANKTTYYSTIEYSNPVKAAPFTAVDILLKCLDEKKENLQASHRQWWHNFYQKSFVDVPDARINNYYWIQKYTTGCSMRSNLQMMDLMGPWYVHTVWQGIWWNLNTQLMYGHLLSSNNLDAAVPLGKILDEHQGALVQNVTKKYRYNSAGVGRGTSFDMLSEVNPDDTVAPYYNRETGNLTWAMHNYYQYYRYSMDDGLLRNKIFPLLKRSINLYIHLAFKTTDGKYHLPVTMSPEYKAAADCNYDLSLFRWGLQTLIASSKQLKLKDTQLNQWKDILANLVDYPVNETGFMIGREVALETAHRHFSHLLMIYPLGIFTASAKANESLIRKSISHWANLSGHDRSAWSYSWAAGAYAYLQDGNEAYKNLQSYFKYSKRKNYYDLPGIGDNTMYREVGMCAETPFSFVKSLNEMLLQSHNGVIKIFPAIPGVWQEVSFIKLRTEGAFLISASRKNGQTNFFAVESLVGGQCVIQTDIAVDSLLASPAIKINKLSDFSFSVNINKAQAVLFYKKDVINFSIKKSLAKNGVQNYWGTKINTNANTNTNANGRISN